MNLFDQLVTEALRNKQNIAPLRMVVEKELLHHDILRIMRDHHLTASLTFIGGTCLRCCYGAVRLSEDLDFTGGNDFSRENLATMGSLIVENLQEKYGLKVNVTEPIKDKQNVDTWKIKIETRPESRDLPAQRINIDICALPSYEKRPMLLLNPYGVDMGTSGLVLQAQSREEIYVDKLIAIAFRPNRLKYRDLWDIAWLHGQMIKPQLNLISQKLNDRQRSREEFLSLFVERITLLKNESRLQREFMAEMQRFLPTEEYTKLSLQPDFLQAIIYLLEDTLRYIRYT